MSVDYDAVVGVGVEDSRITYNNLTDYTKSLLKSILFETTSLEELEDLDEDDMDEKLEELYEEIKSGEDFLCDLGLDSITGNMFTGRIGYRGVGIRLNIDTIKEDVEKAKEKFKKIVNLEPEFFCDVYCY